MEICGFGEGVIGAICRVASMTLCPNIGGQILTSLVMDTPKVCHALPMLIKFYRFLNVCFVC
jgi:hypothetical protein